jgi:hypothetical protein
VDALASILENLGMPQSTAKNLAATGAASTSGGGASGTGTAGSSACGGVQNSNRDGRSGSNVA